jgi:hypothetical protein
VSAAPDRFRKSKVGYTTRWKKTRWTSSFGVLLWASHSLRRIAASGPSGPYNRRPSNRPKKLDECRRCGIKETRCLYHDTVMIYGLSRLWFQNSHLEYRTLAERCPGPRSCARSRMSAWYAACWTKGGSSPLRLSDLWLNGTNHVYLV